MSEKRQELMNLIDSSLDSPPLSYWNSLLDFFRSNQKLLNLHDMEILCTESERCRLYWNKDKTEIIKLCRAGDLIEQTKVVKGLNINKEDINPKIYEYLETLQKEEDLRLEEERLHEELQSQSNNKIPSDAIPMVASAKE